MPFVSITRLRVRFWRYVPRFLIQSQSLRAALQAKRATGNLAISVLRDADRAFWTRTVWRDEPAMRAFMQSGVQRRVMARLPEWRMRPLARVHWFKMPTNRAPLNPAEDLKTRRQRQLIENGKRGKRCAPLR
jgi:heme-degrading monooxygenase HmoA